MYVLWWRMILIKDKKKIWFGIRLMFYVLFVLIVLVWYIFRNILKLWVLLIV